ncbi:unnamed protein product [Lathyrus oleraceus]
MCKREENGDEANEVPTLEAMEYNLSSKKCKKEATTYLHLRFPAMLMAIKYQSQYQNCNSIYQWKNKVVKGCIPAGGWISVEFFQVYCYLSCLGLIIDVRLVMQNAIGCNMALFC